LVSGHEGIRPSVCDALTQALANRQTRARAHRVGSDELRGQSRFYGALQRLALGNRTPRLESVRDAYRRLKTIKKVDRLVGVPEFPYGNNLVEHYVAFIIGGHSHAWHARSPFSI
jgi:hypothetical protein